MLGCFLLLPLLKVSHPALTSLSALALNVGSAQPSSMPRVLLLILTGCSSPPCVRRHTISSMSLPLISSARPSYLSRPRITSNLASAFICPVLFLSLPHRVQSNYPRFFTQNSFD